MAEPAIRLERVWWSYGRTSVLHGVDLTIGKGECVVVRGRNGSGKTTLARLCAGALVTSHGCIERATPVGYVPQASDDPPAMRASRWLEAMARVRRTLVDRNAVEDLGIAGMINRPLSTLSTGTVVKVLIAGAVMGEPQLLIFDEPFADIDPAGRQALLGLLTRARERGCGVLLTDHQSFSRGYADREVVLDEGLIVATYAASRRWRLVIEGSVGIETRIVSAAERDAALLAALRRGQSVLAVEPVT